MQLVHQNGVFVAQCSYAEKDTVKDARFRWHGAPCSWRGKGKCPACTAGVGFKVWWTDDNAVAAKLVAFANDDVKAKLNEHVAFVEESRAVALDDNTAIDLPCPAGLSYMPFQQAGIASGVKRLRSGLRGFLLADEPGLGKTIQSWGVVNCDEKADRVLILCPASLRINWLREGKKWSVKPRKFYIVKESTDLIPADAGVVICNYDLLVYKPTWSQVFKRIAEYIEWEVKTDPGDCTYTDGQGMLRPTVLEQIESRRFNYLFADEAHYLKNARATRSKLVLGARGKGGGLIDHADKFIPLTGTPIVTKPMDMHPLLALLDPKTFGNFFTFGKRYCNGFQKKVGRDKFVWDFSGSSNSDELQEKLRSTVMIRRLKKDVLTDLPPKRRQLIVLPMDENDRVLRRERDAASLVQEKLDTMAAHVEEAAANLSVDDESDSKARLAYVEAVGKLSNAMSVAFAETSIVRHATAVKKIPFVVEHLETMFEEGVGKVICFVHHHDVADALQAKFADEAVSCTGSTSMGDRQAAVDRFQNDPSCKLFIGNIQAAGTGLTLTAASHVVFAELSWVPNELTQAEDRAHRYGQKEHVLIQHLVFDGSLDARQAAYCIRRQDISDGALDRGAKRNLPAPFPVVPATQEKQDVGVVAVAETPAPPKYPEASFEHKQAAQFAMQLLAGVCDGAQELDGAGFNRLDTTVGHKLANLDTMTDGQVFLARRLATKYKRQLPADVLVSLGIS